jgi:2-iminobutanoate/2-iminopropanoate deaminase
VQVAVQSSGIAPPVGPFSPTVRCQGMLYLSGQVAQQPPSGRLIAGGAEEQTVRALEKVRAILESAGRTLHDVLRVGVYLTDMKDLAAMNTVYARYFREPFPARTTVAVRELPLGALVEIDAVAAAAVPPALPVAR